MRRQWLLPLAACLALVPSGLAQAQDDARAILAKAIKAHGGEEKISKYKAGRAKTKGKIVIGGGLDFTEEVAFQLPDKLRDNLELEVNNQKVTIVTVINGKKAGIEANGKKVPLDETTRAALKEGTFMLQVSRLVPLKGKGFQLALVGDAQVNNRPAVGIRVSK
jgi:hypothetical protein